MDATNNSTAAETTAAGTTTMPEGTTAGEATQAAATASTDQLNSFQKFLASLGIGGGKDKGTGAQQETPGKEEKAQGAAAETGKSYTQQDLDTALEKARLEWETSAQEKARLEKLSPEERAKAEAEAKDKELEGLKAQLLARDLKQAAVGALDKEGFPVKLAEIVDYSSKENMENSLATVQSVFQEALADALKDKLRGKTPIGLGDAASAEGSMKDQIAQNIRGGLV
uniref:capsid assembly scaffolding protein Gp46 family protein n=1 Tax=Eisenbergiella tayi TaxID=1432052 RepID=UPI003FEDCC81